MSDSLMGEFISSFGSYVPEHGSDIRRRLLMGALNVATAELVKLLPLYDLAALMTCAVHVDPFDCRVQELVREVETWQQARQDAEYYLKDPDEIAFDPTVGDIDFKFDQTIPSLADFFKEVKTVEGGKVYLAQIIVCLAWAHSIDIMIPNLYSPSGQE